MDEREMYCDDVCDKYIDIAAQELEDLADDVIAHQGNDIDNIAEISDEDVEMAPDDEIEEDEDNEDDPWLMEDDDTIVYSSDDESPVDPTDVSNIFDF